jgi:RNA polymerase sigma-70 factor, ECF subfamily
MADNTEDTDDLILNLLEADDLRASSILYKCHYRAVYRYIKDFIHNDEDAKDLVQELFTAIWEKRHTLNLIKPLRSYLFSAAHNKAINHLRDQARKKRMLGEIVNRSGSGKIAPSADGEIEADELARIIKEAIALLPPKTRATFLMSRKQNMTYQEIARHLNVTDKAVEKNMSKALALLRKYLGSYLKVLVILLNY